MGGWQTRQASHNTAPYNTIKDVDITFNGSWSQANLDGLQIKVESFIGTSGAMSEDKVYKLSYTVTYI